MSEQIALARANTGEAQAAIADLERLNREHGKTPERLGIIGGRYKRLAREDPANRERWLTRAIDAYQEGMDLDLNEYYCASNLPQLYLERQSEGDLDRAKAVAVQVVAACERARKHDLGDEWLEPTLLVQAFIAQDLDKAWALVDEIVREGEPARWMLDSCIGDLSASLEFITDEATRSELTSLRDKLVELNASRKTR